MGLDIIKNQFNEMLETKKAVSFKTKLQYQELAEPKDYDIRLEYVMVNDTVQILGKATHIVEDTLLAFYRTERQEYNINNYLISAEQISQRVVRNASKFISPQESGHDASCNTRNGYQCNRARQSEYYV